jgi:hypothetical protein
LFNKEKKALFPLPPRPEGWGFHGKDYMKSNIKKLWWKFRWMMCGLGIHQWKSIGDNKIFPFTSYKCCKNCGKIDC